MTWSCRTEYSSWVSSQNVDETLSAHRLYVHSSMLENCPFVIIEAFRSGLPVLAAPVGGVREVVGDDGSGRYWDLDDRRRLGRIAGALARWLNVESQERLLAG
ncbi:MAG: glycosyltransferase [Nocardioidaceae bacterium]